MIEPAQDQHLAARQQGGIDLEARVLGRRADQGHGAVLDKGQEAVLLRAIEAVDLVHEQQGLLARFRCGLRFGEHLLEIGNARKDGRNGDEAQADRAGEQSRDGRLAGSRRPPQDHRRQAAGGDHPPDRAVRAGQMLLPDDLVVRCAAAADRRAAHRRRGVRLAGWKFLIGEQVGHREAK